MNFDVLVIGAGMAGTSVAAHLAQKCRVGIVEMEDHPGFHSTGRSAALFSEIYGNDVIRALSRASRAFFVHPFDGFTEVPLLHKRGALYVAREDQMPSLTRLASQPDVAAETVKVSAREAMQLCPILRDDYVEAALFEPGAMDIDVDALHQGYIRMLRAAGAELILGQGIDRMERLSGLWHCHTREGVLTAPLVVNAAGAWADAVGAMAGAEAIGLVPTRRTAVLVPQPVGQDLDASPIVIDVDEQFYFKPDAGTLLLSPCDEDRVEPCDVHPEDLSVAIAVDRVQAATKLDVRRLISRWAGLRNFVADRTPVVGLDSTIEGFFWLAGQGGYGIQTAPALSALAASLVLNDGGEAHFVDTAVIHSISPARAGLRFQTFA